MTILSIALLIFIAIAGIGLLVMQPVLASYTQNYMMRVRYTRPDPSAAKAQAASRPSALVSLCRILGQLVLRVLPAAGETRIKRALLEANFRKPEHLEILIGVKTLCASFFMLIAFAQFSGSPSVFLIAPILGFCAWTIPNFTVLGKAKHRNNSLLMELPTLLDLIAVCSRAGLGLVGSLDKVAKEMKETCPTMVEELDQLLVDIKMFARPLHQALTDMSSRCGVEELENLTAALIIADQKGADISTTLIKQSMALRERIRRKAEEQLSTAPVKMVPITIFFILPLMMIPTLGPPAMLLVDALQQLTHTH